MIVFLFLNCFSIKLTFFFHIHTKFIHLLFVLFFDLVKASFVLCSDLGLLLDIVELDRIHELVVGELVFLLLDAFVSDVRFELFGLDLVLLLNILQSLLHILLQIGLLILMLELQMLDLLFHLIQLHDVVLLQFFYLGSLVQ